jgi:nicotinic acid mononucleotide adenylyltransferase
VVKIPVKIALLGGADLVETFSQPGLWSPLDLDHILVRYGAVVIERVGTDLNVVLKSLAKLEKEWKSTQQPEEERNGHTESVWVSHIHVIHQVLFSITPLVSIRKPANRDG